MLQVAAPTYLMRQGECEDFASDAQWLKVADAVIEVGTSAVKSLATFSIFVPIFPKRAGSLRKRK